MLFTLYIKWHSDPIYRHAGTFATISCIILAYRTGEDMRDASGLPWMVLMKLGRKEHMEQFRTGLLYMNALSYFQRLEADTARGDRYEGIDSILQPQHLGEAYIDSGIPTIGRIEISREDLAGPITVAMNRTSRCNLFCLYALTSPVRDVLFSSEHDWFGGDSLVLIINTQEFLNRISKAALERKLPLQGAPVEYFDETSYSGKVGRFKKSSRFSYQHEYRIAIETGIEGPFLFQIGDIRDITSEVIPFDRAEECLKFTEADAREAGLTW